MAKAYIHAVSSAKKWGGEPEDYLAIHDWFDETKGWVPDNRHRALRHHSEGIFECERLFGTYIVNSAGRRVQVRDIGEQHVLEDFGNRFIPVAADYFGGLLFEDWMGNMPGSYPPSHRGIAARRERVANVALDTD